jgi:hypothetical protein
MNKFISVMLITLVGLAVIRAHADDDETTYSGYQDIVNDLSSSRYDAGSAAASDDFDVIRFHAGVGLITSHISLDLPHGLPSSMTMSGYEAHLGIDLFSPNWMAEGAVRSYDPEHFGGGEISLKEFDLLFLYSDKLSKGAEFNMGVGLAARYLDFTDKVNGAFEHRSTTPATIFTSGVFLNLNSYVSVGPQISYRSPLTHDSADRGSFDGGLRFAGRF